MHFVYESCASHTYKENKIKTGKFTEIYLFFNIVLQESSKD